MSHLVQVASRWTPTTHLGEAEEQGVGGCRHPCSTKPGSLKEKLLEMVTFGFSCDEGRGEAEAAGGKWRREGIPDQEAWSGGVKQLGLFRHLPLVPPTASPAQWLGPKASKSLLTPALFSYLHIPPSVGFTFKIVPEPDQFSPPLLPPSLLRLCSSLLNGLPTCHPHPHLCLFLPWQGKPVST